MTPTLGEKVLQILQGRLGMRTRLTMVDEGRMLTIEVGHITCSVRDIGTDYDHFFANMDDFRELGTYVIHTDEVVRLEDAETGAVLFQAE